MSNIKSNQTESLDELYKRVKSKIDTTNEEDRKNWSNFCKSLIRASRATEDPLFALKQRQGPYDILVLRRSREGEYKELGSWDNYYSGRKEFKENEYRHFMEAIDEMPDSELGAYM